MDNVDMVIYAKLSSFKHKNVRVKKVIENNSKQCGEDIEKRMKKKSFELYVKTSFPEVYDYYLTNQKHIPYYFCDYLSQSQVLKSIENDIINHMD